MDNANSMDTMDNIISMDTSKKRKVEIYLKEECDIKKIKCENIIDKEECDTKDKEKKVNTKTVQFAQSNQSVKGLYHQSKEYIRRFINF